MHNRRVLVQGRHGTGKSSHVEQVGGTPELAVRARQPRWPCDPHWI
jgi:MoxR-like ATPase